MTDDAEDAESYKLSIDPVAITDGTGHLGADVNGALPVPATGLFLSSEVYPYTFHHSGEPRICQNYLLLVCTSADRSDVVNGQNEPVLYADDFAQVERVFSAIVSACVRGESAGKLPGAYASFHNQAQLSHDETLSEACCENLECTVSATEGGGFEVLFHSKDEGKVCRFGGALSPVAIADLQAKFAAYRSERARALSAAGAEVDRLKLAAAHEESAAPSP
jgi:hypothetical protein